MSIFSAMSLAQSGIDTSQTWLDTIAGNVANVGDTVRTSQNVYRPETVVAAPAGAGVAPGVQVTAVLASGTNGVLAYLPGNPLADNQGMVRESAVDLGQQLSTMVAAQTGYQANVAVLNHAKQAYQSALTLGS